jgi:hypothetical protein
MSFLCGPWGSWIGDRWCTLLLSVLHIHTTSYNIIQHYTTSYNIIQHHTTSYNIIQHHTTRRRKKMKEWERILSFSCHLILVILSFLSYCHFPVHPAGSQVTPRSSQSVTPLKLIEDMQPRASSHCELRKVCHLMSCHHGALSQTLVTLHSCGVPKQNRSHCCW